MRKLAAAGNVSLEHVQDILDGKRVAPIVCDKCGEINIMRGALLWQPSEPEMAALKQSPIWPVVFDLSVAIRSALTKGEVH